MRRITLVVIGAASEAGNPLKISCERPKRSGVRIRAGPPQAKGLPHKLQRPHVLLLRDGAFCDLRSGCDFRVRLE